MHHPAASSGSITSRVRTKAKMNSRPTFAIPLTQPTRSEVLEWRFPKPHGHLVLTGRSRAAWHTSFIIPQLGLLLDAGLCVNNQRPKTIFLTHGHADHTLLAFAFVQTAAPPDIYCPAEMQRVFDHHILATATMDLGGLVEPEAGAGAGARDEDEAEDEDEARDEDEDESGASHAHSQGKPRTHFTHGVQPGDTITLGRQRGQRGITATVFRCDHTVPCVGYVFRSLSHRLKPRYESLGGAQLRDLRQSGVALTEPHSTPIFAFLGDTTASTLASEPSWLREGIPVVITECSFLYDEHSQQADKTKHTKWRDLEPIIRKWPRTTFVLTHFSMRYSDRQVCDFFRTLRHLPQNMVIWADPED